MHCSRVTTASPSTSPHGAVRHNLAMSLMKALERGPLAKPRPTLVLMAAACAWAVCLRPSGRGGAAASLLGREGDGRGAHGVG